MDRRDGKDRAVSDSVMNSSAEPRTILSPLFSSAPALKESWFPCDTLHLRLSDLCHSNLCRWVLVNRDEGVCDQSGTTQKKPADILRR